LAHFAFDMHKDCPHRRLLTSGRQLFSVPRG